MKSREPDVIVPRKGPEVLWWGRFDPGYSRNRIVRRILKDLGWRIRDFSPRISAAGDVEARLRSLPKPDLVWVPCFRQRDVPAARRWSTRHGVPMLFDPLISAYDKRVFEKGDIPPEGDRALRLREREARLFRCADIVLADTQEHARFFRETFCLDAGRIRVVPVGAEEELFFPSEEAQGSTDPVCEVVFFGSFIPLQGPLYIVDAIHAYRTPRVRWRFVGRGPLFEECRRRAGSAADVRFDDWIDYRDLPALIRRADILLGIFGTTPKAGRVIPNKVFQSMACGKPVVTRRSPAYPEELLNAGDGGIAWVDAGDPAGLASAVAMLACDSEARIRMGRQARSSYERHFGRSIVQERLREALEAIPRETRR